MHHRIDDRDVWLVSDGLFEPSADALVHADGEAALAAARKAWGRDTLHMNINLMLLKNGPELTLIDTGLGDAWKDRFGPRFGKAREFLRSQDIRPRDIDRIFLTHLHSDHAFGLFDGDAAYFPEATVFAPEGDLAYYTDPAVLEATPQAKREPFQITARLLSTYGARVKPVAPGRIEEGLEAISLPGHSPGHMGYLIGTTRKLLTVGDVVHIPELQIGDPRLGVRYDHDLPLAMKTRIDLLQRAASNGWLLTGAHMDGVNELRQEAGRLAFKRLEGW